MASRYYTNIYLSRGHEFSDKAAACVLPKQANLYGAILLKRELGWEVAVAYNTEQLGKDGTFGRTSYHKICFSR